MAVPDFIVIGAKKGGTSSLYSNLARHPEIAMALRSEVEFFCHDLRYGQGLDSYRSQFPEPTFQGQRIGEVSPGYLCDERVPERLAAVLPGVKLVATLREPVGRAFSSWLMQVSKGSETRDFETAYAEDPNYSLQSRYGRSLESFAEYFPVQHILPVFFEELIADPRSYYDRIFRFLGVAEGKLTEFSVENRGGGVRHPAVAKLLHGAYRAKRGFLSSKLGRALWNERIDDWTRRLRNRVAEANRAKEGSSQKLDPALRERLAGDYAEDCRLLLRRFPRIESEWVRRYATGD